MRSYQLGYKANTKTPNRAVNNIEEHGDQFEDTTDVNLVDILDLNSSYMDSDEDYYVNMITDECVSPNKLVDENGDPKYFFVKLDNSEFNIMVDAGSVVSLVTKQKAQETESHDSSAWWSRQPNSMRTKIFNNSAIQNLGTLYCDVQSNGWNGGRVDLIAVPNSHRAIIGRDLFKGLGLRLYQQSSNSE